MKLNFKLKNNWAIWICIFLSISCAQKSQYKIADNPIDCLRKFVQATLKGNFDEAHFYIFKDSTNQILLKHWHKTFNSLKTEELEQYKNASIQIIKDSTINDTTSLIMYQNSHKKETTAIKILKIQDSFLVDLKYTFYGQQW